MKPQVRPGVNVEFGKFGTPNRYPDKRLA